MKEETPAELLALVLSDPEDDAPRLVCADWLAERGSSRGEFIQLQCALRNQLVGPPSAAHQSTQPLRRPEGWEAMDARARSLLKSDARKWLRPIKDWLVGWYFTRGFLNKVALGQDGARHLGEILAREPITEVSYSGAELEPSDVADLLAEPLPARVHTLDLFGAPFVGNGIDALVMSPHVAHLSSLTLYGCDVDDRALERLASSPHLPALRTLTVTHQSYPVQDSGMLALARSPHLPSLRIVSVQMDVEPETHTECSRRFTVLS